MEWVQHAKILKCSYRNHSANQTDNSILHTARSTDLYLCARNVYYLQQGRFKFKRNQILHWTLKCIIVLAFLVSNRLFILRLALTVWNISHPHLYQVINRNHFVTIKFLGYKCYIYIMNVDYVLQCKHLSSFSPTLYVLKSDCCILFSIILKASMKFNLMTCWFN